MVVILCVTYLELMPVSELSSLVSNLWRDRDGTSTAWCSLPVNLTVILGLVAYSAGHH